MALLTHTSLGWRVAKAATRPVRICRPRANAFAERWLRTVREECPATCSCSREDISSPCSPSRPPLQRRPCPSPALAEHSATPPRTCDSHRARPPPGDPRRDHARVGANCLGPGNAHRTRLRHELAAKPPHRFDYECTSRTVAARPSALRAAPTRTARGLVTRHPSAVTADACSPVPRHGALLAGNAPLCRRS